MHCLSLLWLTLVGHVFSACGPPPIAIPITDVALSNGHSRRGVQAAIGTPSQNISFMINAFLNDTWIYNATDTFCGVNDTEDKCTTLRGGLFNTDQSSSYAYRSDVVTAGADPRDTVRRQDESETSVWASAWAADTLSVGNASLENYAIGMPGYDVRGPFDTQAFLGLGSNSTLLQRLKDDGHIASRSWSYWWGIDNSESRSVMDGQLVLGGYDAAKLNGPAFTQQLQEPSSACASGMVLTFTGITLNFPNGTSTNGVNPRNIMTACVEPDFPAVMTIPATPYFWRFQDITQTRSTNRTLGTYWFTPTYPSSNVYSGSLEIQVQGGPAITISNDILVVPDEWTDEAGATQYDTSTAVLLFSPIDGPNANDPLILGMNFFSAAYLTVNLDNSTWTIWPAKATQATQLVTIGDGCEGAGYVVGSNSTEDSSEPHQNPSSPGLSTGVIAGVAVGGAVLAISLCATLICCIVRRRNARKPTAPETAVWVSRRAEKHSSWRAWHNGGMIDQNGMQEMCATQAELYELHQEGKLAELPWQAPRGDMRVQKCIVELPATRFW